jgi:vitamin B12 transporter
VAFRAPAIGELFFPFMGNPNLGAERSRSIEAGFDRDLGGGRFSATLFRSDYDGLIVFDLSMLRFENVGRANASGAELAFERALSRSFSASASYTLTRTEEEATGLSLLRRPRHSGSLFLQHRSGNVRSGLVVQYTGERADVLAVAPFGRTTSDAYTTLDANVQLDLGRFTPYVKVENLTDVEYEEVMGYPSPRRRVIVGLRFGS